MGELVYGSELSLLYKKEMKEKIDALNLWNLESEVKVILNKLGITRE